MTPSTRSALTGLRLGFAVSAAVSVMIMTACSRPSNVVEAPMTSVDASAAAIALVNDPRPSPPPPPDKNLLIHIGDRFVGRYVCAQGPTDLTIKIETIGRGDGELEVEATAEFSYDGSTGHPAAEGSYRAVGTFDPRTRRLQLKGDTWIDRPAGYSTVNFGGALSKKGDIYSGSVDGPGCGSFTTTREDVGD